jgi:hypothetical protein
MMWRWAWLGAMWSNPGRSLVRPSNSLLRATCMLSLLTYYDARSLLERWSLRNQIEWGQDTGGGFQASVQLMLLGMPSAPTIHEDKDEGHGLTRACVWQLDATTSVVSFACVPSAVACATLIGHKGVHVHAVAHAQLLRVWPQVQQHLTGQAGACRAYVFTGHSLGGTVAMLAAAQFGELIGTRALVSAYTFGAPKPGDQAFARWYNAVVTNSVRVINKNDPVPHTPTSGQFLHPGAGFSIPVCEEPARISRWLAVSASLAEKLAGVRDHCCCDYLRTLSTMPRVPSRGMQDERAAGTESSMH